MAKERFLDSAYEARTGAEVEAFYDRWAAVYDEEVTENAYQQPLRCAEAMKRNLTPDAGRILDIGCGTGLSGIALHEAGYQHIDGCDFSQGMLEKAFKTGVYSKLFKADLNNPPLDAHDGEYAGVAAVGVFSFSHISADAMDEVLRLTAPGGPIVIGMNNHFHEEGSVSAKLDQLAADGRIERVSEEAGEHLPGIELTGWVIVVRKV